MVPSVLLTALKEIGQFLGTKLDNISTSLKSIKFPDFTDAFNQQTRSLSTVLTRIERAVEKIQDLDVTATIDTTSLQKDVQTATKAVTALKIPKVDTIEANLMLIYNCVEQQKALMNAGFDAITKAISGQQLTAPASFKIDDQQIRALTGSMRGGSALASLPMATRVSNTTVSIANASTEGSYQFPSGTVAWLIKLRDQGTLGYYSWTTGKLPTSGDGSTYMTIPQNFLRSQENVDYTGKTIYLGAEAAATIEIEVFRQ